MANRLKEEERNERIIRGLLKLPDNRRCINCNSLGPQYVCTNFWMFVCTTCSGIHREFSHRVKSVSMAKFSLQEVSTLQEGGNQRAKEIYLKEWDSQRNTLPDGSNIDRLRDFIKHVYVDRRFCGEKTSDRPPRGKMGDKEDSFQGAPQSPPYEENYERRFSDRTISGDRSPGYDQESYRKSPARPEIVNDWCREDRFNNVRKDDERRIPDGESRVGGLPEQPKDVDTSSPPVARPVREILGENVLPLRMIEPPKASTGAGIKNSLVQTQRTASSSSLGSARGRESKPENPPATLIDFDADPEPPPTAAAPPPLASVSNQGVMQTVTSTSDNNWASFDVAPSTAITQPPPPVVNSLDNVLLQFTGPSGGNFRVAPGATDTKIPPVPSVPGFPPNTNVATVLPVNGVSILPQGGLATTSQGTVPTLSRSSVSTNVQPLQSNLFSSQAVTGTYQSTLPFGVASASQAWNSPIAPNSLASQSRVPSQAYNLVTNSTVGINPGVPAQNPPGEVKINSSKELPADLFTATYPSFPAPMMGWQAGIPYAMGYMQYHPVMHVPILPQQSKSVNPFDVNEPTPVQFPSMESLQGALPTMQPATGGLYPFNMGTPATSWGSKLPPSYMPAVQSQLSALASALPPNAYAGQVAMGSNPPSRYPGAVSFGDEGAAFGSVGTNPLMSSSFPGPYNRSSSAPVGGNPFG